MKNHLARKVGEGKSTEHLIFSLSGWCCQRCRCCWCCCCGQQHKNKMRSKKLAGERARWGKLIKSWPKAKMAKGCDGLRRRHKTANSVANSLVVVVLVLSSADQLKSWPGKLFCACVCVLQATEPEHTRIGSTVNRMFCSLVCWMARIAVAVCVWRL